MTEDEAKTKWCPATRPVTPIMNECQSTNGSWNHSCIGSRCMAWQWTVRLLPPANSLTGSPFAASPATEVSDTDGRCGLAH